MYTHLDGEMAEWSNAPVLKTGKDASPSRVRIPVSPPLSRSPRFRVLQSLGFVILPLTLTPKKY